MRNRFWFGMTITVSAACAQPLDAFFGHLHAAPALEGEGLGDDADRQRRRLGAPPAR